MDFILLEYKRLQNFIKNLVNKYCIYQRWLICNCDRFKINIIFDKEKTI